MGCLRRGWSRAALSIAALVAVAGTALADAPQDRTRKLMETFKKVKTAPKGATLSAADRNANNGTFSALDAFFDFPTFTADCLGPSAAKLSAAQKNEFKRRLVDILRRRGYPNGGSVFNEGVVKEGKPTESGGRTEVHLTVSFPKEDVTMQVAFVWKGGKVVDLVLDGDSLAKDYRNQVGRIIAKSGVADLLRRLEEKQKGIE